MPLSFRNYRDLTEQNFEEVTHWSGGMPVETFDAIEGDAKWALNVVGENGEPVRANIGDRLYQVDPGKFKVYRARPPETPR